VTEIVTTIEDTPWKSVCEKCLPQERSRARQNQGREDAHLNSDTEGEL